MALDLDKDLKKRFMAHVMAMPDDAECLLGGITLAKKYADWLGRRAVIDGEIKSMEWAEEILSGRHTSDQFKQARSALLSAYWKMLKKGDKHARISKMPIIRSLVIFTIVMPIALLIIWRVSTLMDARDAELPELIPFEYTALLSMAIGYTLLVVPWYFAREDYHKIHYGQDDRC